MAQVAASLLVWPSGLWVEHVFATSQGSGCGSFPTCPAGAALWRPCAVGARLLRTSVELLIQPELLEEGALLAPDLVRDGAAFRRSSSVKTCAGWPFFNRCIVVGCGRSSVVRPRCAHETPLLIGAFRMGQGIHGPKVSTAVAGSGTTVRCGRQVVGNWPVSLESR